MNTEPHAAPLTTTGHEPVPTATTYVPVVAARRNVVAHALVDHDAPTEVFEATWSLHSAGYAFRRIPRSKPVYMHRVIAEAKAGQLVDHVNGDRLDNRRQNLRLATPTQNNANSRDRRRGGRYRGVYWHRQAGRWISQISLHGRVYHLGLFDAPEAAARAYDLAARAAHGAFARTNGFA